MEGLVRLPAYYRQEEEAQIVASTNGEEDPFTYRSAMDDPNFEK